MASAYIPESPPAFLIFDTESVPDGKLLARVKYAAEPIEPDIAVTKAQAEARAALGDRLRFPAGHLSISRRHVRAARRQRLQPAANHLPRRAAIPAAQDRRGVLERCRLLPRKVPRPHSSW